MTGVLRLATAGVIVSLLAGLGFLAGGGYLNLLPWFDKPAAIPTVTLAAPPACDPALITCTVADPQLTIGLRIKSEVQPLDPFDVAIHLIGPLAQRAQAVAVRFIMPDMNMGLNRFRLRQQTDGHWQGQALLPWCTTGRRDWLAVVEIEALLKRYEARFAFTVK